MKVHVLLLLVAYLSPALLAFVARVPYIDRPQRGILLARGTTSENEESSHNATTTSTTKNATDTGNSTTSSATPVPTLGSAIVDEEDGANSTVPGELPLQPAVTPALGVGGFILLATGAVLALIGVRNLWVQVFLSSACLTSLGVTVLIVYVMNPPVRAAIQGAYLVAIFFTGITFGALAIVFKELVEGLGCLLGGFCTSMWLLSTKSGGLLTETDAKSGFIGAISLGFYAVSFSHYTRPYGLIASTSIAGGTAVALGIDCYSKAGLKEFWLYLWALNDDIFPLGTDTYPVTRYVKVELAVTVIVAVMGVISQLRLWKVVRERRMRDEKKRQEEQRQKDEAEAEAGKRLEEYNMKERMEWEAKYGDHAASESSSTIPELAAGSHTAERALKEKDDAMEKKSVSESVLSYRCSDCRARGDGDAVSDTTGDTGCSGTQHQVVTGEADRNTCANPDTEDLDGGFHKALRGAMVADEKNSDLMAIVGSDTVSAYSKRLSMLSRRTSMKSSAKPDSGSQEALITCDDDAASTVGAVEDLDDVDSDCHTIAADSQYQAMLDEERPGTAQDSSVNANVSQLRAENADRVDRVVQNDESASTAEKKEDTPQPVEIHQLQKPLDGEVAHECTLNLGNCEWKPVFVEAGCQHDEVERESLDQPRAGHLGNPVEVSLRADKEVQNEANSNTNTNITQSQQGKNLISQYGENRPVDKPIQRDQTGQSKLDEKNKDPQPEKNSAMESSDEKSAKGDNECLKLLCTKENEDTSSSGKAQNQQEKKPEQLNAETVERIPKHTSRIIQAYRMNEWAKHLTNADIPEIEPINAYEKQQPDPVEQEETAAPVRVMELLQTPLNAQPPPAVDSHVSLGQDTNEDSLPHDSRTGSQKKRGSESIRRLSGQSVGSAHNLSRDLPPAVQPRLGNIATSSLTLLSHEQGREESERAQLRWKGPAPLIAVREDMMRSRLSSLSPPTDPYARHSTGQSPTDFSPRYSSTFPLVEEDDDDIPLSQRRTMLHQQASPNSPTNAPLARSKWSNSGLPSRANSPAVLAAWRETIREDLKGRRDPLKLAQQSPTPTGHGDRSASPFSQLGQRNVLSTSIGDKIAGGMQRGDMSELHREAMRRMQAKANQSVNRRAPSPAKTAQPSKFRDLPIISPPQIKEPAPLHPSPRVAFQSPQPRPTAFPPFERLDIETIPSRTRPSRLQKPWAAPKILRPAAVRLANPVNYVPRNTPVTAPHPLQASTESLPLESHRDAYPLLTIPERRRSRLTPSPNSLVVERSQQESESGRSSIAVPRGQRHSGAFEDIPLDMDTTTDQRNLAVGRPRHVQSQQSLRSQSQTASIPSNPGAPNEPDVAEELAWGPAHPCFPHINPHVPPGSDEYLTTRIIRIRRDWMVKGDLAPTYSNLYPEILDPLLPEQEFRRVIATVNDELISAFDPYSFRNWVDGAIGLITGWIWEDLGAPGVKSHLRRVENWLEKWNREVGAKDGVRIWGLRRTAYMSLDIQIPDPKVGIVPSDGNPSCPGTRPDSSGV